jgi:uracil-DNA glycosylase family 4
MLYQLSGIDEIISETPINRLNKSSNPVLSIEEAETIPPLVQNLAQKKIIPFQSLLNDNFNSMTQGQAITALVKKQQNNDNMENDTKEQNLLVPISQIVAQVKKTVDTIDNLQDLEKAVRNFDGCHLKKMATNTVFCDGDPKSKIMIIGEAPGNNEDLQGIPFCGDSGKLMNEMFAAIGLPREKVYITNSLFWRPPGNRRPTDDELAMCKPFVEKHIGLIAPKLIVLMGATAMYSVLGSDEAISKVRGKFLDYKNPYLPNPIKSISLFHPSYLMRQSSKKRLAWADMLEIKNFLQN